MYIIAGLGNPEAKYEHTRHNTGFAVADILSDKWDIKVDAKKHGSLCGTGTVGGCRVFLMKPQTYMNLSGEAISDAVNFYKIDPSKELIVIYDDIDLPVGKMRIRPEGSAGGHNGMKDIIARLGTERFTRVRVGVGAKPEDWDLADWVLSRFSPEDEDIMKDTRKRAAESVCAILEHDTDYAMSRFNG
ncbi:MAG: aminoacyl-tRNA hydrolase [Lachnospiraceae bacterium]|nr:aminoacyl-tRNA hydrolase [Lachnospiraceae bacterium]MBQ9607661.1 aminoacyl-tRNA hydrolase [Lachnospiraceae bacterium]MBR1523158.1 aminoacyl-tRNA hydrolase [Lachnospiraceae bacterium]